MTDKDILKTSKTSSVWRDQNRFLMEAAMEMPDVSRELMREHKRLTKRMMNQYQKLLDEIDALRKAGKPVTVGRVFRTERFRALYSQTALEYRRFAQILGEQLDPAIEDMLKKGWGDGQNMIVESVLGPGAYLDDAVVASFTRFDKMSFEAMVGSTRPGAGPLRKILEEYGDSFADALADELRYGIAVGRNPNVIARRLASLMDGNITRARTIARTETMRAYRYGQTHRYANSTVVKYWVWHADLGTRTCAACWALHGRKFEKNAEFGTHPNCRCRAVPVTKTWEQITGVKTTRDTNPWNNGTNKTGPQTFRNLPEADQRKILGNRGFKAYKDGEVDLEDFVREVDTIDWGTTRSKASVRQAKANAKARGFTGDKTPPAPSPTPPTPPPMGADPGLVLDPATGKWIDPNVKKPGIGQGRTFKDTKAGRRVKERVDQGVYTVDDIKDVGKIVREESGLDLPDAAKARRAEWERLKRKQFDAKRPGSGVTWEDAEQIQLRQLEADMKWRDPYNTDLDSPDWSFSDRLDYDVNMRAAGMYHYQETVLDTLDEIRPMHKPREYKPGNRKYGVRQHKSLNDELRYFPDDWVKHSDDAKDGFDLSVSPGRAHYSPGRKQIRIDPGYWEREHIYGTGYGDQVMRHELAHRMEDVVPDLDRLGIEFRNSRAFKKPDGSMWKVMYHGEEAVADMFSETYAGRVYSFEASETISMAIETLYAQPSADVAGGLVGINAEAHLPYDEDWFDFILGLLACL